MLENVLLGSVNLSVTVILHAFTMIVITSFFRKWKRASRDATLAAGLLRVVFVVMLLFLATLLEVLWWAASYVYLGAIETFEAALYFSMVTFTTLGYGDITLEEQWRLLSSFQAANGVIIAGWSTALLFALIQRVYLDHHPENPTSGKADSSD